MTSPDPQPPPAPRVCHVCGRTESDKVTFPKIDEDICWRDYARRRRPTPANQTPAARAQREGFLREAKAAVDRMTAAETQARDATRHLRAVVRLAHNDTSGDTPGLSLTQLADLLDMSVPGVHKWIPDDQRAGHHGPTTAPDTKVAQWATPIRQAAAAREEAADRWRETRRLTAEVLRDARDRRHPGWVGTTTLGEYLGVPQVTVWTWSEYTADPDQEPPS